MPLLTSSCPFGLGGLNCGNREYPQVENWDWVGPGQLRASSSLHCVLKSWAGCVRKTEREARMALSQPQILGGEINTCAQLHLCSEHDESGIRWEARKSPPQGEPRTLRSISWKSWNWREVPNDFGQTQGWRESEKDVPGQENHLGPI